jgi:asparagine synthase (glutamine-hydrolysing)
MQPAVSIICQNYFTEGAAGDERHYARKAADAAGVNLFETSLKTSDRRLVDAFESTGVATPVLLQMVSGSRLMRERLARTNHVGAIFSGQGGDHLFQQSKTPLIAADYAWLHGMKPRLRNIVVDTAHLTGKSIWAVVQCVIANGFLRHQPDPYAQIGQPLILSAAGREMLTPSCISQPWVDNAVDIPCGKRAAILSVIDTQNFYHSSCAYADVVHPLVSQPLMELCLQIPSYVLTYSGVDRALVRDAFRKSLPPEIATRTTKGCTTSYFHGLLVRDLPFLREYLLDGLLSKAGIVDTTFVEASLRESALVRDARLISPLLNAIRAEVWLRTWNIGSRQKAA